MRIEFAKVMILCLRKGFIVEKRKCFVFTALEARRCAKFASNFANLNCKTFLQTFNIFPVLMLPTCLKLLLRMVE